MRRLNWGILLAGAALVAASAFLPCYELPRGEASSGVPFHEVPGFLGAHVIGLGGVIAALGWLLLAGRGARGVGLAGQIVAMIGTIPTVGLLGLLVLDCLDHHGRSPDVVHLTTPLAALCAVAALLFAFKAFTGELNQEARAGRVAWTTGGVALAWFVALTQAKAIHYGLGVGVVGALLMLGGGAAVVSRAEWD